MARARWEGVHHTREAHGAAAHTPSTTTVVSGWAESPRGPLRHFGSPHVALTARWMDKEQRYAEPYAGRARRAVHGRVGARATCGHPRHLGGGGLGKTHVATALGSAACLQGYSVLFASASEVINTLAAARSAGRLKAESKKYPKPTLLILDELGYLPIDKAGADLLCQVISLRYEQGAIVITSHRAFKEWPKIFNNDRPLTSAILDRLLHHAETVLIAGKSFRMKDQLESEPSLDQALPDGNM
jgi:IstB-like ATP binding protein